jgi:hypothetical protein
MKITRLLCLCFFVTLPAAAAPDPQIARVSGFIEGAMFGCARVNPAGAAQYASQARRLLAFAGNQVDEARGTSEYRQAFAQVTSDMSNVPKSQAVSACTGFLARK